MRPTMRIFVTRSLPGDAVGRLAREHEVDLWHGDMPPPYGELAARCARADGIICLLTDRIDAQLIESAPQLRVISNVAVGYDNVDIAAATARGIPVGNTPGVLTEATADLTFALLLACARHIVDAERFVRDGRWRTWDPGLLLGMELRGATLGIVGYGQIGRAVARRAAGFGMRVMYATRDEAAARNGDDPMPVHLDALLRESDIVSLHVPLSGTTRHLIGEQQLRAMKPSAILINTARGPVVDQPALARALHEGWIAAAGVDVTEVEPIPMNDALLAAPNLTILPHIGSATHTTRERMAAMAVDNALAGVRGARLPHCVNPEVYGRKG